MFNIFSKPAYKLTIKNDSVFCKWHKDITQWSEKESDEYLAQLQSAVKKTVSQEKWELITKDSPRSEDVEYQNYVEAVKKEVILKFGFEESFELVRIGLYHSDMLVISFPAQEKIKYPYYFMGVQLKPYKKTVSRTNGSS